MTGINTDEERKCRVGTVHRVMSRQTKGLRRDPCVPIRLVGSASRRPPSLPGMRRPSLFSRFIRVPLRHPRMSSLQSQLSCKNETTAIPFENVAAPDSPPTRPLSTGTGLRRPLLSSIRSTWIDRRVRPLESVMNSFLLMSLGTILALGQIDEPKPFPFFEPINPPRSLQAMAHRGANRQAPENSAAALEFSIADSVEWVEVDVRLTKAAVHGARLARPR